MSSQLWQNRSSSPCEQPCSRRTGWLIATQSKHWAKPSSFCLPHTDFSSVWHSVWGGLGGPGDGGIGISGQKLAFKAADLLAIGNACENIIQCEKSEFAHPNRSRLYQLALSLSKPSCIYNCPALVFNSIHNISLSQQKMLVLNSVRSKKQCC